MYSKNKCDFIDKKKNLVYNKNVRWNNMEVAKKHIIEAVRELRKLECKCNKKGTCERCIDIFKQNIKL